MSKDELHPRNRKADNFHHHLEPLTLLETVITVKLAVTVTMTDNDLETVAITHRDSSIYVY